MELLIKQRGKAPTGRAQKPTAQQHWIKAALTPDGLRHFTLVCVLRTFLSISVSVCTTTCCTALPACLIQSGHVLDLDAFPSTCRTGKAGLCSRSRCELLTVPAMLPWPFPCSQCFPLCCTCLCATVHGSNCPPVAFAYCPHSSNPLLCASASLMHASRSSYGAVGSGLTCPCLSSSR